MDSQDNKPAWYQKDVQSINADAQSLLESYSGLAPAEVLPHVLSLVNCIFSILYSYTNLYTSEMKPLKSTTTPVSGKCVFSPSTYLACLSTIG